MNRRSLPALVCASACAFAFLLPLNANAADSALALLQAGVRAPLTTSYTAQVERIHFGARGSRQTLVRIEHLAPNATRRTYLAPEAFYGNTIVQRGNRRYECDRHHHRFVIRVEHDPDDLSTAQNFALLARNYRAEYGQDEMIAGYPVISLSLINRHTGEKTMSIWLERNTHLILSKVVFHRDGAVASEMRFEKLRYTNKLPANTFSTSAPSGYIVVTNNVANRSQSAGSGETDTNKPPTPIDPHFLPEGFALIQTTYPTLQGVPFLHLLYSDGIRSLSIFENQHNTPAGVNGFHAQSVKIGERDAQLVADGANNLLTWQGAHSSFTLVGDLSKPELLKIANSLR